MQQKELAKLLGISPAMVSRLHKRGMPTDSLERAKRWRKRHLEPGRVKGSRFDPNQPPTTPTTKPHPADVALPVVSIESIEVAGAELDATLLEGDPAWSQLMVQDLRVQLRRLPGHAEPRLTSRVWLAMLDWLISPECKIRQIANKSERLTPRQFGFQWHRNLFTADQSPTDCDAPFLGHNTLAEACDWRDVSINGWPQYPDDDEPPAAP